MTFQTPLVREGGNALKLEIIIVLSVLLGFIILEILFTSFFKKPGQKTSDGIVEIVSSGMLLLFTQPTILVLAALGMSAVWPDGQGAIATWPIWSMVLLLLVFDDMMQYWWHRLSHTLPWLYKLHRPHHNAEYLSIRVVYRNNLFYYMLMPGLWFSGILLYFGVSPLVYGVYLVTKLSVIYGAHSDVRWDAPLYKIKALSPLMWVVERTISTPATHSAHHGKYASDSITNYHGNYGNLLFFWDVLFGTAKITRQYPAEMGVENLPETSIGEQLLWPLITKNPQPKHVPAE